MALPEAVSPSFSACACCSAPILSSSSSSSPSSLRPLLVRDALVFHTDDSEVTLNLSLGREFEGGELVLRGLRNGRGEGKEEARIKPRPGRAVLHLGQHLHEVTKVLAGERYALIMWARNEGYRETVCPCCLIARRDSAGCVCGSALN